MEKVDADLILNTLKELVESKKSISREQWLECAFKLNLLRIEEAQKYNQMRQGVAQLKIEIKQKQDKVNISAIEMEIEATNAYRYMRDQEDKIYSIDEFVRIAKKNSDVNF